MKTSAPRRSDRAGVGDVGSQSGGGGPVGDADRGHDQSQASGTDSQGGGRSGAAVVGVCGKAGGQGVGPGGEAGPVATVAVQLKGEVVPVQVAGSGLPLSRLKSSAPLGGTMPG